MVGIDSLKLATDCAEVASSDNILSTLYKNFIKIDSTCKLSSLAPAFREVFWCIIVQGNNEFDDEAPDGTTSESFVGLLHQGNFLTYVKRVEKHHQDNYQIALTDGIVTKRSEPVDIGNVEELESLEDVIASLSNEKVGGKPCDTILE